MPLTFTTVRTEQFRTSDLNELRRLIKGSLLSSYSDRLDFVQDHFADIRFTQSERHVDGRTEVLITLTAGSTTSTELMDWIAGTMEEKFLFQGNDVRLLRD